MTVVLVLAVFGFVVATLIAPAVDDVLRRRRRSRAELRRCGGVVHVAAQPGRSTARVDAPHWTRDPSPRPRGDYEWRAIGEGLEQT